MIPVVVLTAAAVLVLAVLFVVTNLAERDQARYLRELRTREAATAALRRLSGADDD